MCWVVGSPGSNANTFKVLRWDVHDDKQKAAIVLTLEPLFQSYEFLRDTDYKVFYDFLKASVPNSFGRLG